MLKIFMIQDQTHTQTPFCFVRIKDHSEWCSNSAQTSRGVRRDEEKEYRVVRPRNWEKYEITSPVSLSANFRAENSHDARKVSRLGPCMVPPPEFEVSLCRGLMSFAI